jgi:hypothetical protein
VASQWYYSPPSKRKNKLILCDEKNSLKIDFKFLSIKLIVKKYSHGIGEGGCELERQYQFF